MVFKNNRKIEYGEGFNEGYKLGKLEMLGKFMRFQRRCENDL